MEKHNSKYDTAFCLMVAIYYSVFRHEQPYYSLTLFCKKKNILLNICYILYEEINDIRGAVRFIKMRYVKNAYLHVVENERRV